MIRVVLFCLLTVLTGLTGLAWTDNRFKLLTGQPRRGEARTELFDLLADPKETTDIAAQHPDVVKRMLAELHAWQRSVERSLTGADYLEK